MQRWTKTFKLKKYWYRIAIVICDNIKDNNKGTFWKKNRSCTLYRAKQKRRQYSNVFNLAFTSYLSTLLKHVFHISRYFHINPHFPSKLAHRQNAAQTTQVNNQLSHRIYTFHEIRYQINENMKHGTPEASYPDVYTDTFIFFLRSSCKIIWMNVCYFPNAPRTKHFQSKRNLKHKCNCTGFCESDRT